MVLRVAHRLHDGVTMDFVKVVYRGPEEAKMMPGYGGKWFDKDVPQLIERDLAERLVANNPEPWQGAYCDVFEILEDAERGKD